MLALILIPGKALFSLRLSTQIPRAFSADSRQRFGNCSYPHRQEGKTVSVSWAIMEQKRLILWNNGPTQAHPSHAFMIRERVDP
jgi:hypothetical protein